MCIGSRSCRIGVCALLWFCATVLYAQEDPPTSEESKPGLPTIADEPTTIDPVSFMPPPLAAEVTVDLTDSSLSEVLNWLRDERGLVVLLDNEALAEIGILPGDPVFDRLDEAPIYLLLNRLRSLGLAWYFADEVLHVTSSEVAENRLTTLPYSIGDLLDADYDADTLVQVIEKAIAPDSWESVGGSGVVSFLGDVMFVRQTDSLQREVRGLIAALKQHGRRTFSLDPPQHARLRQKLGQNVTVAFRDTPLETAVRQLAEQAVIDIRLDAPALRAIGVREREPITLSLTDRKLRTALQAMLIDHDLTWILRDGVLWVTSREEADALLKTAVYDVRDLCRDSNEADALRDAIVSQTEEIWSELGGDGTIEFARPGTLVIHSTERMLAEVLSLLETYRTALRTSKPRQRDKEDPHQVITVYYRMHAEVAQDLSELLPRLVRPGTWKSATNPQADGEVFRVSSPPDLSNVVAAADPKQAAHAALVIARAVLIIRQTRAAHDEIREVISRVEAGDRPLSGGLGGMGGGFGGGFFSAPPADSSKPWPAQVQP